MDKWGADTFLKFGVPKREDKQIMHEWPWGPGRGGLLRRKIRGTVGRGVREIQVLRGQRPAETCKGRVQAAGRGDPRSPARRTLHVHPQCC